jgi:ABC-2 type transport system ATP-binding protein
VKNSSQSSPAVTVSNVTKSFQIPLESSTGFKQKIINTLKGRKGYRVFTPLKNISFEIKEGEFFGIVGRNGSGKSTLLKTIAGIYEPNIGTVNVEGTLVPFIELGVGFNPELTGKENVFLNGALLGFSHDEMAAMYSDIVEFAELDEFMEEKLKNYSSGMQVRLAFSIAIRAEGDVLLLDEVLAVGDEAFQKKCYAYFDQLKREKRTVILVTHDMSTVERFCSKALFLEDGEIKLIGKPSKVAAAYTRSNDARYDKSIDKIKNDGDDDLSIKLLNETGKSSARFNPLDELTVSLSWKRGDVKNVGVAIFRENGEYVFGPNTYQEQINLSLSNEASYKVKLNLNEGSYFIKAALMGETDNETLTFVEEGPHFTISKVYDQPKWGGVTQLDHEWVKDVSSHKDEI